MAENRKPRSGDVLDWLGITRDPSAPGAKWQDFALGILLGFFLLAVMATIAVLVQAMAQAQHPTAQGPNLGAGALIAALLGAPLVIWGTVLKHQTLRYQKEGHITDRINTAVEQLGAEKTVKVRGTDAEGKEITIEETRPNIEVRIGAILSLERIAQDSTRYDKGRDHVRVMEILCAYVRENSNARKPVDFPEPEWEPLKDNASGAEWAAHLARREDRFGSFSLQSKAWIWAQTLPNPRADVAQALQVIGRRSAEQRRVEAAWPEAPEDSTVWPFNLPCPHLPDIPGERTLTGAEFAAFRRKLEEWKSRIGSYDAYRLDLRGANLQGADLSAKRPDASDAMFGGALLSEARMEGANLRQTRMEGASLAGARMEGAYLGAARMEGAVLREARMEGANLGGARMEGANLTRARMERANLGGARMEGANLTRARMDSATNLTEAKVSGAAVRSIRFSQVAIAQDQIDALFGDASVVLPAGLDRPTHWPDWELPNYGAFDFKRQWKAWQDNPQGHTPSPKPKDDA